MALYIGCSKKIAQSLCTAILQPYITEKTFLLLTTSALEVFFTVNALYKLLTYLLMCGLQQNIQKEIAWYQNMAIEYSLFCSWQVNYLKTKLTSKYLRQIHDINKVCAKPTF